MTREEYRRYLEEYCGKKACFEQPGARCDTCMYEKGRADMKADFIGMLEREFNIQNNSNSKFVETIVLRRNFIEQLKGE